MVKFVVQVSRPHLCDRTVINLDTYERSFRSTQAALNFINKLRKLQAAHGGYSAFIKRDNYYQAIDLDP